MPSVGPSLPPAKAEKRKRDARNDEDGTIPHFAQSPASGSTPLSTSAKKIRTMGPTLPPASLDERPAPPPETDADSSTDDDGFGPSLPTVKSRKPGVATNEALELMTPGSQPSAPVKSMRDEWMIVPPSSDDWSSRVDPTKLKNCSKMSREHCKGDVSNLGDWSTHKNLPLLNLDSKSAAFFISSFLCVWLIFMPPAISLSRSKALALGSSSFSTGSVF